MSTQSAEGEMNRGNGTWTCAKGPGVPIVAQYRDCLVIIVINDTGSVTRVQVQDVEKLATVGYWGTSNIIFGSVCSLTARTGSLGEGGEEYYSDCSDPLRFSDLEWMIEKMRYVRIPLQRPLPAWAELLWHDAQKLISRAVSLRIGGARIHLGSKRQGRAWPWRETC